MVRTALLFFYKNILRVYLMLVLFFSNFWAYSTTLHRNAIKKPLILPTQPEQYFLPIAFPSRYYTLPT